MTNHPTPRACNCPMCRKNRAEAAEAQETTNPRPVSGEGTTETASGSGVGALEVEEALAWFADPVVLADDDNGSTGWGLVLAAEVRRLQAERYAEGRGRLAADAECARLRAEVARLRAERCRDDENLCRTLGMKSIDFMEALNVVDGIQDEVARLRPALREARDYISGARLMYAAPTLAQIDTAIDAAAGNTEAAGKNL